MSGPKPAVSYRSVAMANNEIPSPTERHAADDTRATPAIRSGPAVAHDEIELETARKTAPVDIVNALEFGHEGKTRADQAARAGVEQHYLIPTSAGEQEVTSKWEKYSFMVFRM